MKGLVSREHTSGSSADGGLASDIEVVNYGITEA
jgi:hypothetical protein